jgi:hypothetical protein
MVSESDPGRREVNPIPKNTRPWNCKKDDPDCTRTKPCRSCMGTRSRRSGLRKQRQGRKLVGVPDTKFAPKMGNEEGWEDPVARWEVKSGAQIEPVAKKFLAIEQQSDQSRALGDSRPVIGLLMPPGWGNEGLVLMRASAFSQIAETARQALDGPQRGADVPSLHGRGPLRVPGNMPAP